MTLSAPKRRKWLLPNRGFLSGASERLLEILDSEAREVLLQAGDILFDQGDDGDALYAIVSGAVEFSTLSSAVRKLSLDIMRAGAVFGEIALFDPGPRTAAATALEPSRLRRLRIAVSRIAESEDDELAYAFYAANDDEAPYDRKRCAKEYLQRAMPLYRPQHVERAMAMVLKAVGFEPRGRINRTLTKGFTRFMEIRLKLMA